MNTTRLLTLFCIALLSLAAPGSATAQPVPGAKTAAAKATFAGGCFWCMEEAYDKVPVVIATVSGYMGGHARNPTYEQIVEIYDVSQAECIQLLVKLDRIGFIRLLPNNRIRLLVSRDFAWLPDGPIQRFFKQHAHGDFNRSRFDHPDEYFLAVNGMLSGNSRATIVARLKRIAREFSELHSDDVR